MLQRIKVWNNQRRYRRNLFKQLRDKHELVREMQESWLKHLELDRKEKPEEAQYWLGRYEGLAWTLKVK